MAAKGAPKQRGAAKLLWAAFHRDGMTPLLDQDGCWRMSDRPEFFEPAVVKPVEVRLVD